MTADDTDPKARQEAKAAEAEQEDEVLDREGFEQELMQKESSDVGEDVPHVD